jgi:membrane protease subunit HflK
VTPPPEAADSFRDVASARADAVRIVNQAEGYANDVIPKARRSTAVDRGIGNLQTEEDQ